MKRLCVVLGFLALAGGLFADSQTLTTPVSTGSIYYVPTGTGKKIKLTTLAGSDSTKFKLKVDRWDTSLSYVSNWTSTIPGVTALNQTSSDISKDANVTYTMASTASPSEGSITIVIGSGTGPSTQTITVTPTAPTAQPNTPVTLTASGSETDQYDWWSEDEGIVITEVSEGVVTVTAPASIGVYDLYCQSPAGGGFAASNVVQISLTVTPDASYGPSRQLTFTLYNSVPATRTGYIFDPDGYAYSPTPVAGGATGVLRLIVPYDDETPYFAAFVDVWSTTAAGGVSASTFKNVDGSVVTVYDGFIPDASTKTPTQTGAANGTPVTTQAGGGVGSTSGPRVTTGPQVTSGDVTHATGSGSGALTSDEFAAGVNAIGDTYGAVGSKIVDSVNQLGDRVDALGRLLDGSGDGTGEAGGADGLADGISEAGDGYSVDNAKAGAAGAAGTGVPSWSGPTGGTSVNTGMPGAPGDFGQISIGGRSFDFGFATTLNRFSFADQFLQAGRTLVIAAALIWFAWSVSSHVTAYVSGLPQVSAASAGVGPESVVPGVSQAKSVAMATLATTAIFTGVAALIAAVVETLTGAGLGISLSALGQGLDLNALGAGVGLLNRYLPLAAMVSIAATRAAVPYVLAPVYTVTASTLKFFSL